MKIYCSDYLLFQKGADFFVYDKKSAFLYSIDNLHYAIGLTICNKYKSEGIVLDVEYFIQQFPNYDCEIVRDHYSFIFFLFFKERHSKTQTRHIVEDDVINSLSTVPQIVVEVTERCNFRCDYCYYGDMYSTAKGGYKRDHNISEEDCLNSLRYLLSIKNQLYSNKMVLSFYGGEPLMNFELIKKIVCLCKDEYPEIEFQYRMTTNGSLLMRHIDYLVENDFHLLVSLDGDEQSNRHRCFVDRSPVFSLVKDAVDSLYHAYREYFLSNVDFISVLNKDSDILSICRFFSEYGKTPLLTNLSTEGVVDNKQVVLPYEGVSQQEMMSLSEMNRQIYDLIKNKSHRNMVSSTASLSVNNICTRGCYLFANKIFLSADGLIFVCEKSSRNYPFGDFIGGKLNFNLEKINRYYESFDKVVKKECSSCSMCYQCERCFFEGPSLMNPPMKCKQSDLELLNALNDNLVNE